MRHPAVYFNLEPKKLQQETLFLCTMINWNGVNEIEVFVEGVSYKFQPLDFIHESPKNILYKNIPTFTGKELIGNFFSCFLNNLEFFLSTMLKLI